MYGTEKKLEKPFAVIEKVEKTETENHDDSIIADSQPNMSFSILDSTVNIENRTKSQVNLLRHGVMVLTQANHSPRSNTTSGRSSRRNSCSANDPDPSSILQTLLRLPN
jgi:hypothetical protein